MPLPKPKQNETETEFVSRCLDHPQSVADFPEENQRLAVCFNLYENKYQKKNFEDWADKYRSRLDDEEEREALRFIQYYQNQYNIGIREFLLSGKTDNFLEIFKTREIQELYQGLYNNVGLAFAKLYQKEYDNAFPNMFDTSGYDDLWSEYFKREGLRVANVKGGLVQGTARKTLVNVLKQLQRDPDFQALNEREAGRILQNKFSGYADWQARRVVRTEATNSASFATLRTAKDMYGAENLKKEWISTNDGRTREAHVTRGGKFADSGASTIVDFDEKFYTNGEYISRPGQGGAGNVINCRCAIATIYKEDV